MWVDRLTLCLTLSSVALLGCGSSAAGDLFSGGAGGDAGQGQGGSGGTFGTGGTGGVGSVGGVGGVGVGGAGGFGGTVGGSGGSFGSGGDGGAGSAGGGGGTCNFAGTWAAYTTIPMIWPATDVLTQGKGTLQVWLLTRRTVNGMATSEIGNLCGITLPPFATILGEKHGVRFLAEAFDHMPDFTINANVGAYEVGGSFDTEPAAIVFGATMNDPVRDPWPVLANLVTADDDRDQNPGVTTPSEKGNGFYDPIVDFTLQRASFVYVASRTVVVVHGTAVSCDELRGELEVPSIGGNPALDSHIVGCKLASSGAPCNTTQAQFVDTNGPDFQPATGTTFLQRRVPDDFTCAQVRGMYPALPNP
jgi:hypothetical protein